MTYNAYCETLEEQKKKEDKLSVMEDKFNTMQSQMQALINALSNLRSQDQIDQTAKLLFKSGLLQSKINA